jgi:hypothetical protein
LWKLGRAAEAINADYGAWQDLGLALVKLKRWPEAVATFAEMSRREPRLCRH